jgi:uncharacterized membrane protein
MEAQPGETAVVSGRPRQRNRLQWGLVEFLGAPLLVVLGFAVLAGLAIAADRASAPWLASLRAPVSAAFPPSAIATSLQTIAPGLLTTVSIIFFVMVMALQQQAGKFTSGVLDQFMQRRLNQGFFGFYVGLTVYVVAVLTMVPSQQMVLSAAIALVLIVVAVILLLVFIYNTFDQMRPSSSASLIEHLALRARARQRPLLARCYQQPRLTGTEVTRVTTVWSGYVVGIDIDALAAAIAAARGPVEIEFEVALGAHLVPGDTLAKVRGRNREDREQLATAVLGALTVGRMRNVGRDAGHSVDQLGAMAWAASSAQQDPEGASVAVGALHSLLACWNDDQPEPAEYGGVLPIVYSDKVVEKVLDALTAIIVATGQSGQHQTCAEVLAIFAEVLPRLSPGYQRALVDDIGRVISTATAHVLTGRMEQAIGMLRSSLYEANFPDTAVRLEEIRSELARQVRELSAAQR